MPSIASRYHREIVTRNNDLAVERIDVRIGILTPPIIVGNQPSGDNAHGDSVTAVAQGEVIFGPLRARPM